MVGWQRNLQSIIRHVGKRVVQNFGASIESSTSPIKSPSLLGDFSFHPAQPCYQYSTLRSSTRLFHPYHQYLQKLGISSSRSLLADASDASPSPFTPVLAIESGKTENQATVSKPSKVQAILKNIKQSPKKVNLVAALVRGMRVEDALLQLQVTVKRASKTVYQVIHSARANATHNHGLDPDRLLIAEAFVGKGYFKKRIKYHARGKCGIMERPECRLTVVVREMTPEEEAEIARLRVSNFRKLTKRERQLVPHQLIETTPIWNRKGKSRGQVSSAMG